MSPGRAKATKAATKKAANTAPKVHRGMRVLEVITLCPAAAGIMAEYGLHCFSCSVGGVESLEDGCAMHDFDDEMIDALVEDLNEALVMQPARSAEVTITTAAAQAIAEIAKQEDKEGQGLTVVVDANGGFCMEFRPEPEADDHIFINEEESSVRVFVSPLTLWRIGGAVIDYREERFKLDLPEDACAQPCDKRECGCHE